MIIVHYGVLLLLKVFHIDRLHKFTKEKISLKEHHLSLL